MQYRSYYRGAKALREMIQLHVDPELPIFMDGWEYAILDYWDGYEPIYSYRGMESFMCSQTDGAYVVATKNNLSGRYETAYPEKDCLRTIPPSWIKIAQSKLGHWEYFKPGLSPVLFYVPPKHRE